MQLEVSIISLRKTIGQLTVIIKCDKANTYAKYQKLLKEKLKKVWMYQNA